MARTAVKFVVVLLVASPGLALTLNHRHDSHVSHSAQMGQSGAPVVTIAVGPDRRLWRLSARDGRLVLAVSADQGRTFQQMAAVTDAAESINTNPETRPRLSIDARGTLHVTYERNLSKRYASDVILRTSSDGGRSFGLPQVVNDDRAEVGHSFHASAVNDRGDLFIVWLDDRGGNHIREDGGRPQARGMYYAVRRADAPAAPLRNHLIRLNNVCECCRPALAVRPDGDAWLFVRMATDNTRDHELFVLSRLGSAEPASKRGPADNWKFNGCPHHGPAAALDARDRLHMVWFTGNERAPGIYYAFSDDSGAAYSPRRPVGSVDHAASHADMATNGSTVSIAWTERRDGKTTLRVRQSVDRGATWSADREIARGQAPSDYPFVHVASAQTLVSWATTEGHRVFDITPDLRPIQ